MPVMSAVGAEVLPATSVTVMPACDRPVPSLKVNGAGVVTPEVGIRGRVGDDRRSGADVVPAGAGRAVDRLASRSGPPCPG